MVEGRGWCLVELCNAAQAASRVLCVRGSPAAQKLDSPSTSEGRKAEAPNAGIITVMKRTAAMLKKLSRAKRAPAGRWSLVRRGALLMRRQHSALADQAHGNLLA